MDRLASVVAPGVTRLSRAACGRIQQAMKPTPPTSKGPRRRQRMGARSPVANRRFDLTVEAPTEQRGGHHTGSPPQDPRLETVGPPRKLFDEDTMTITAATKIGELTFNETNRWGTPPRDNVSWHCSTPLGVFSVVYRDLGLEISCHDTESGLREPNGAWWCRPNFDVRQFPDMTIEQAIVEVKRGLPEESDNE